MLSLKRLSEGLPSLPEVTGKRLAEAASVALGHHKHKNPVTFHTRGQFTGSVRVETIALDEQLERSYGDSDENTDLGACGIAILFLLSKTDDTIVGRARKGSGVDYFLGKEGEFLFQNAARLEVSGISSGEKQEIQRRRNLRMRQSEQSGVSNLSAYIVVVEFSQSILEVFHLHG
jgi:hypothetical protein